MLRDKLLGTLFILSFFVTAQPAFSLTTLPDPIVPSSVQATIPFDVSFSFNLEAETDYYIKVRLGQADSFSKAQTFNAIDQKWLSDTGANGKWELMPKVKTDSNGFWSGTITAKTTTSVTLGENFLKVSLRKVGTTTNNESPTATINITAAPEKPPPPPPEIKIKVILSEFIPNPKDGDEWVEIYNPKVKLWGIGTLTILP